MNNILIQVNCSWTLSWTRWPEPGHPHSILIYEIQILLLDRSINSFNALINRRVELGSNGRMVIFVKVDGYVKEVCLTL